MTVLDVRMDDFELQVEVDVIHWPLPEKVNAMPEDCYEAEEGMLEWNIINVYANNTEGLDIDDFANAVQSSNFEVLLWEAIARETIY